MKMSTLGRYGLRAMVELAEKENGEAASVKEISLKQDISPSYLENIMMRLKAAGLVHSRVGTKGGFILSVPADEIKVLQIINAIEGSVSPTACADDSRVCPRADRCLTRPVWVGLKNAIEQAMVSTSLQDVVEGKFHTRENRLI